MEATSQRPVLAPRIGDVAAFDNLLRQDRRRWGLSIGEAAWRFGVTRAEYRALEAGDLLPSFDTYDWICKLFGWSQSFVGKQHGLKP